jgi:L-malate glycosyltransferase
MKASTSKRMLVVCPYPFGVAPSQRLKFEQYYDIFREDGWDITIRPFISPTFWKVIYKKGHVLQKAFFTIAGYLKRFGLLGSVGRYDLVYVHLWATPFGPPIYETLLRKLSRKMVYDIDDLVYLKNTRNAAHPLVSIVKGRNKPIYLMKHADHVVTCTPYLDNFVRQHNLHTTDISSTVDTDQRYHVVNSYADKQTVTIGWSGSLSTSKYFYLLKNVFLKLQQRHSFRLLVMGDPGVTIPGLDIEAIPWKEEYEISTLQRFDIGVYPLPEEDWVYGKSGLKAIQYMALGIPTVATAIGANYRVIEDGVSGFLVKTDDEWVNALSELIRDSGLRKTIGSKARARVEQMFSIKANKEKYLQILNGLVKH